MVGVYCAHSFHWEAKTGGGKSGVEENHYREKLQRMYWKNIKGNDEGRRKSRESTWEP